MSISLSSCRQCSLVIFGLCGLSIFLESLFFLPRKLESILDFAFKHFIVNVASQVLLIFFKEKFSWFICDAHRVPLFSKTTLN